MNEEALDVERQAGAAAPVAVVGIGVSAASLESLEKLFALTPRATGVAFVVVSLSEGGVPASALLEAINRQGGPPAQLARDGEVLEPDRCYVAPGDVMATLRDGRLHLAPPEQAAGHRGTVDTFLISLAQEERAAAVAVLLAELGDAGSIGLAQMKICGGLALAEASEGAAEPQRQGREPEGAVGLADVVTPLAEIPTRLLRHVQHLREISRAAEAKALGRDGESRLPAIAAILRNRTGHDFHGYKPNTFLRRIQRRMHVVRLDDLDAYVERLRTDPEEVQNLFQDLLIGVTQFFRDPAEFEVLRRQVIPELLRGKSSGDTLRIWVLGCATGEEAYSLCMLVREAMAEMDSPPHVQVFATDIDVRALAVARSGRYPQAIEKDVPPERLARWFVREGGTYCIHKDLREMCVFSAHNIIKDAPFSRIDLISCRNLLIYLNSDLQDRVIPLFHFSLRPGGFLFLGPSENVTRHPDLFQALDRKHRIFRRLATSRRVLPEFPLTARTEPRPGAGNPAVSARPRPSSSLARRAERVVERYAPAYVIVDEEYEVLNFSGRTGPFLDPSSGAASLNLLNLVHRDLRLDLRSALHRAAAERRPVRPGPLVIGHDEDVRRIGFTVEPVAEDGKDAVKFVVLFHDYGPQGAAEPDDAPRDPALLRDEHVQRLEGELKLTKDRLQATIEELESTNEELKSSNEEYQSVNEELQSANEELETSKEELQAVNEELQTVNGELAHRLGELARANSDLKNLLESTQIATLFLDNDLRVKSFTPSMAEVFHLIDNDLGRPIAHIASRVSYPELDADVRRVLRTLSTIERQIGPPEGPRYLVRVLPYRSVDNFIAGAVLTFLDITETTRAQAALHAAERRLRLANSAARIVAWEMDPGSGTFTHSEPFEPTLGFPPPPTLRALLASLHPEDRERVALAFDRAVHADEPLEAEGRLLTPGGELWLRFSGAHSDWALLGVFQDVNDRRRAEAQRALLVAELQHRVKNILAVVRSLMQRTLEGAKTLKEFGETFSGRLDALARTQRLLANRGVEGVGLAEIVRDELAACLDHDGGQVEIGGPDVLLKDKAAEAFALAVHELATNAVKYGALAGGQGRLSVHWRIVNTSDGARLSLEWRESGVRGLDAPPVRTGFGRELIERGLPYDLDAATSLDFAPGGVRCTVEVPLGAQVMALSRAGGTAQRGTG